MLVTTVIGAVLGACVAHELQKRELDGVMRQIFAGVLAVFALRILWSCRGK